MDKKIDNYYFDSADEAEAAFYSAFEMADMDLMTALMADDNVSCIHPNEMPVIGRLNVLSSWKEILANISSPAFYPEVLHRSLHNQTNNTEQDTDNTLLNNKKNADAIGSTAIHLVAERIAADHNIGTETSLVLATNIYIKQKNGWRMMMHHSSMPPFIDEFEIDNDPSITHSAPVTLQ